MPSRSISLPIYTGGTEVDPVCKMNVMPASAAGRFEYGGKTWYFCSVHCLKRFSADPEAILHPPAKAVEQGSAEAEYTCPMDPEVVQRGPGSCPKCGMALEPTVLSLASSEGENPEMVAMKRRLWVSLVLTIPVVLLAMSEMAGSGLLTGMSSRLTQLLLATPVVLWGGWPFFERAWASLINRSANMFTLIGMGTGAAWGWSTVATLAPGIFPAAAGGHGGPEIYFETAAVIVTLVLLGQVLELRARGETSSAIRKLLELAPQKARRIGATGIEEEVALEEIASGNMLRVRPGEKVPVDGTIVEGSAAIDESMVTGEPMPAAKVAGDGVIGGTIIASGSFVMLAERVGSQTLVARIVRLVGEAQRSRAPIQRLADRVASIFVPTVIGISLLALIGWGIFGPEPRLSHGLASAIAVLIVACPCALGLATPMSIMVGVGRGALAGVLIRDAVTLETLGRVETIVLDKTGTLTSGRPEVATVMPIETGSPAAADRLLGLAAALERGSEHPLAGAIIRAAESGGAASIANSRVEQFETVAGQGVRGMIDGAMVCLGNPRFLASMGLALDAGLLVQAEERRREGETIVFLAINGAVIGAIGVADPIKPGAVETVAALRREGLRIVMLTGDNQTTATAVARQLGIEEVIAEVLPDGKSEVIASLMNEGRLVAMAGDGVNDAPALARASVGIAMGNGTDIAIESAGIALVKGDLSGILRARRLSRATIRNIRQNLFFAFLYNALGIPLAAGVLYPALGMLLSPMIAGAAMTFSSVTVITNALRLRRVRL